LLLLHLRTLLLRTLLRPRPAIRAISTTMMMRAISRP
jgi:hypothetical protein